MIKTKLPSFILLILLASFVPFVHAGSASAHVYQSNNGVAAILHIPPDDNPKAGQTTRLEFSFDSDKDNFAVADCDCAVDVVQNGKTLQTANVERKIGGVALQATADVRFPTIGIYNVIVKGTSKSGAFQPFQLTYVERVATTAEPDSKDNTLSIVLFASAGVLLIGMIAYFIVDKCKSPKHKKA